MREIVTSSFISFAVQLITVKEVISLQRRCSTVFAIEARNYRWTFENISETFILLLYNKSVNRFCIHERIGNLGRRNVCSIRRGKSRRMEEDTVECFRVS